MKQNISKNNNYKWYFFIPIIFLISIILFTQIVNSYPMMKGDVDYGSVRTGIYYDESGNNIFNLTGLARTDNHHFSKDKIFISTSNNAISVFNHSGNLLYSISNIGTSFAIQRIRSDNERFYVWTDGLYSYNISNGDFICSIYPDIAQSTGGFITNDYIYFLNNSNQYLTKWNKIDCSFVETTNIYIPSGGSLFRNDVNGHVDELGNFYISIGNNGLFKFDSDDNMIWGNKTFGANYFIAFTLDYDYLYFYNRTQGNLLKINKNDGNIISSSSTTLESSTSNIFITNSQDNIFIAWGNWKGVYVFNKDLELEETLEGLGNFDAIAVFSFYEFPEPCSNISALNFGYLSECIFENVSPNSSYVYPHDLEFISGNNYGLNMSDFYSFDFYDYQYYWEVDGDLVPSSFEQTSINGGITTKVTSNYTFNGAFDIDNIGFEISYSQKLPLNTSLVLKIILDPDNISDTYDVPIMISKSYTELPSFYGGSWNNCEVNKYDYSFNLVDSTQLRPSEGGKESIIKYDVINDNVVVFCDGYIYKLNSDLEVIMESYDSNHYLVYNHDSFDMDEEGNIYYILSGGNYIRKINTSGNMVYDVFYSDMKGIKYFNNNLFIGYRFAMTGKHEASNGERIILSSSVVHPTSPSLYRVAHNTECDITPDGEYIVCGSLNGQGNYGGFLRKFKISDMSEVWITNLTGITKNIVRSVDVKSNGDIHVVFRNIDQPWKLHIYNSNGLLKLSKIYDSGGNYWARGFFDSAEYYYVVETANKKINKYSYNNELISIYEIDEFSYYGLHSDMKNYTYEEIIGGDPVNKLKNDDEIFGLNFDSEMFINVNDYYSNYDNFTLKIYETNPINEVIIPMGDITHTNEFIIDAFTNNISIKSKQVIVNSRLFILEAENEYDKKETSFLMNVGDLSPYIIQNIGSVLMNWNEYKTLTIGDYFAFYDEPKHLLLIDPFNESNIITIPLGGSHLEPNLFHIGLNQSHIWIQSYTTDLEAIELIIVVENEYGIELQNFYVDIWGREPQQDRDFPEIIYLGYNETYNIDISYYFNPISYNGFLIVFNDSSTLFNNYSQTTSKATTYYDVSINGDIISFTSKFQEREEPIKIIISSDSLNAEVDFLLKIGEEPPIKNKLIPHINMKYNETFNFSYEEYFEDFSFIYISFFNPDTLEYQYLINGGINSNSYFDVLMTQTSFTITSKEEPYNSNDVTIGVCNQNGCIEQTSISLVIRETKVLDKYVGGIFPPREELTGNQIFTRILLTILLTIALGVIINHATSGVGTGYLLPLISVLVVFELIYFSFIGYIPVVFIVLTAIVGISLGVAYTRRILIGNSTGGE